MNFVKSRVERKDWILTVPKMVERSLDNLFYVSLEEKDRIEEYTQIPDRGL